jgi:uncharacterized membrane protein YphA (DoxX/SURF4 family)
MGTLSKIGRIFFGVAIAGMGFQTIYYHDFPYMLIPPKHSGIPGLTILAYISGVLLMISGACIAFDKKAKPVSLLLGIVLLLIFCFGFIPYQFVSNTFMNWGEWENAEKELALAGGAFVIAGCFSGKNENSLFAILAKLIPIGAIIFSLTMICFGTDHFLYAKDTADYMPSWVPYPMFWVYVAGTALLASGIAIILKIKRRLAATLLGIMIFIWVIILHIPKVIAAPSSAEMRSELTSTFLALAYSGIAFVIAGAAKNNNPIGELNAA